MAQVSIVAPAGIVGANQDPKLATMTVVEWLVSVGDVVKTGQLIVALSSDKVDLEMESPASGVVAEIKHQAGGGPIATTEILGYIETGT